MFKNQDYHQLKSITLNKRQLCDFELIVNGGFSPLNGFMDRLDYESCVENMRLHNSQLFALPITLCISEKQKEELSGQKYVLLKHETGLPLGIMDISSENSIYKPDIVNECIKVFGSDDLNHPYSQILDSYQKSGLVYNIGGSIIEHKEVPHYDFKELRLTPAQTKEYFKNNGWNIVIGFQTRNPMHRTHFELTKYALKSLNNPNAKLLVHPVVGITQDCDIDYYTRVKCYKKLMKYYDENTAKLSLLPLSMRMAGPREAVMHAIIRKNYGCTHFIVGRDHAGPTNKKKDGNSFYDPYGAQDLLFKHAEEIGIIPIVSKEIVYALPKYSTEETEGIYLPIDKVDHTEFKVMSISGTQQREMLQKGVKIPGWFTYEDISEELQRGSKPKHEEGVCIYLVGLSGAGKTTIANFLIAKLKEYTDKQISYLDADIIRMHLSKGLGFSKEDRSTNVQRIGYVCSEIVKHNGIVVVANIAPFEEDRQKNRKLISQYGNYIEVFVNASLDVCEDRDVKGLYKQARLGLVKEFTGISSPFEEPKNCELTLDGNKSIDESIDLIINYLIDKKLLSV